MSKFLELDHRLNRHATTPNPDCPVCNPTKKTELLDGYRERWPTADYIGTDAPNWFPDWGTTWVSPHTGHIKVFVQASAGEKSAGIWVDTKYSTPILSIKTDRPIYVSSSEELQIEIGSGKFIPSSKVLGVKTTLPAGLHSKYSPMGADVVKETIQSNRAKLLKTIFEGGLFPIGYSVTEEREDYKTDFIYVEEIIRAIELSKTVVTNSLDAVIRNY